MIMIVPRILLSLAYAVMATALMLSPMHHTAYNSQRKQSCGRLLARRGSDIESDGLMSILSEDDDVDSSQQKIMLMNEVSSLESSFMSDGEIDDPKRFNPLLGLYEVAKVLSKNKRENPVGGKWTRKSGLAQKIFRTRKTFQHILPYNSTGLARYDEETAVAEAINVISLDSPDGLLRATVILRGDVIPLHMQELKEMNTNRKIDLLTNLAVRANFDPPRIFLGKRMLVRPNEFNYIALQIGPVSDVVLDTSFNDKNVRIGMGGTSGTRFIFKRTTDNEAREYASLLQQPLAQKRKLLGIMTSVFAVCNYVAFGNGIKVAVAMSPKSRLLAPLIASLKVANSVVGGLIRLIAGATGLVAGLTALLVAFSSGGIEREGMQVQAEAV